MRAGAPMPSEVGPYRVLRPIARGGMAEVFEVEHVDSGEHLALKLLIQKGTSLQRFSREYEAMSRLNHPNIVRVYHYGVHEGMPWLTMELLQGEQVQVAAKNAGRPGDPARLREVLRIGHDVARALDHLHRRGLIHRDIKSANVLVLPDGRVKILDFGATRLIDGLEVITKAGEFLGTLAYAAPEQIRARPVDGRADLYALGALLYRLLSGVLPFQSNNANDLAAMVIREAPRPLWELVPGLPDDLVALVHELLAKSADARPARGSVVAQRLEAIAGEPLVLPGTLGVISGVHRLFGREAEVARYRGWLAAPRSGSMLLVVGGEGSGRDAMMQAIEAEIAATGARVAAIEAGPGDEAAQLARLLAPIAASFEEPVGPRVRTARAALEKAQDESGLAASKRREMVRMLGALLVQERARADGKPVVLVTRRLEAAPPALLDLIGAFGAGLASADPPVILVGDCTEAADEGSVGAALPAAERVRLGPLDVRGVALLVGALLHRRPPPAPIARRILDAAGGQPEYVEEVVRRMVDGGLLKVLGTDPNRLEWTRRERLEVPSSEAAHARLSALIDASSSDRRRVLEALVVAGDGVTTAELAEALERGADEIRSALQELRGHGLIVEEEGAIRWREPLAGRIVDEQLQPSRRDVIRRRLLASALAAPPSPSRVRLLAGGGAAAEAVERALRWGEQHLAAHEPVTALEALDLVAELAERSGAPAERLVRFWLVYAGCLLMARPMDPGIARSLQLAAAHGEGPAFAADLALMRARVQRVIGHYPNYRAHLIEAWTHLQEAGGDPAMGADIAERIGVALHLAGLMVEAGDWLKRARALAIKAGSAPAQLLADAGYAVWVGSQGRLKESERMLAKLVARAEAADDARGLAVALPAWCDALRQQGRYSEALDMLGRRTPALRHGEAPSAYVRLLVASAWCEIDLCRLGRAQECVDELLGTLRLGEHLHLRLEAELVLGRILLASGRLREAHATLQGVMDRARTAELILLAEHARALLAETAAAFGSVDVAAKHFRGAAQRLEAAGDVAVLAAACVSRARALPGSADAAVLLAPVRAYAESQPAFVLRLEWHLAHGRFLRAQGQDATAAYAAAKQVLDRIAEKLNDTDRAALRVHPWTREIHVGTR